MTIKIFLILATLIWNQKRIMATSLHYNIIVIYGSDMIYARWAASFNALHKFALCGHPGCAYGCVYVRLVGLFGNFNLENIENRSGKYSEWSLYCKRHLLASSVLTCLFGSYEHLAVPKYLRTFSIWSNRKIRVFSGSIMPTSLKRFFFEFRSDRMLDRFYSNC